MVLAVHDLPDRAGGINNRRARRIGHEGGQRLQRPLAATLRCKRENVRLLRLKAGHRSLQHLDQPLIEQRDAGWSLVFAARALTAFHSAKRKMRGLSSGAKLTPALWAVAFGHGVRDIGDGFRRPTHPNRRYPP